MSILYKKALLPWPLALYGNIQQLFTSETCATVLKLLAIPYTHCAFSALCLEHPAPLLSVSPRRDSPAGTVWSYRCSLKWRWLRCGHKC